MTEPYRELIPLPKNEFKYRVNMHRGQTRAMKSKARFVVVCAGTQGGKTCFEPDWLRREIKRCEPGDYLVITTGRWMLRGLNLSGTTLCLTKMIRTVV